MKTKGRGLQDADFSSIKEPATTLLALKINNSHCGLFAMSCLCYSVYTSKQPYEKGLA